MELKTNLGVKWHRLLLYVLLVTQPTAQAMRGTQSIDLNQWPDLGLIILYARSPTSVPET